MPRNGSGAFGLVAGNPVVPSTVISSTWANNTLNDIASGLTQSIANDGQTTPVANLPMATFRHTNVGNAAARNEYAAAGQVQDSSLQWLTSVAGTNTVTASIAPSPSSYTAGQIFRFVVANTNTGPATLNINGLGAKSITKNGTTPIGAGDLIAGAVVEVTYDGTQFQKMAISESAMYEVRELNGLSGTPSGVQASFSCGGVVLWSPTTSTSVTSGPVGSRTNDISISGPIANGRDQLAGFPAATTVHFYYIWDGTNVQTISSLALPSAGGPVLPTGYTHWAYIGGVTTVAGALRVVVMRGSWFSFSPLISAGSFGSVTTAETAVSTAGILPVNTLNYNTNFRGTLTSGGGGAVNAVMFVRIASGTNFDDYTVITAAANTLGSLYGYSFLPYFGNSFIFAMNNITNVSTASFTVNLHSYQVPNGG